VRVSWRALRAICRALGFRYVVGDGDVKKIYGIRRRLCASDRGFGGGRGSCIEVLVFVPESIQPVLCFPREDSCRSSQFANEFVRVHLSRQHFILYVVRGGERLLRYESLAVLAITAGLGFESRAEPRLIARIHLGISFLFEHKVEMLVTPRIKGQRADLGYVHTHVTVTTGTL